MSIASWYQHRYATWNRTRRLQQSPYLARTDTNTSRAATAMAQNGHIAVNMGNLLQPTSETSPAMSNNKDKKSLEPLFGPSIGPVSGGPPWTITHEKKVVTDELTPEVVNSWVEKSKEQSHPTTTLQALVNLKRPTLRLSPLSTTPEDAAGQSDIQQEHHHGLEFEYDCDAPKCGIYVSVHLPKDHPDAPDTASHNQLAKLLVFENVVDGGFGKQLKLDDGALLELGRFEHVNSRNTSSSSGTTSASPVKDDAEHGADVRKSDAGSPATNGRNHHNGRIRFSHFHFRKRSHNRSVAGPALAVVDAEPMGQDNKKDNKDDGDLEGVRVTIRLAALDEQSTELASPNEQVTYLHIVRFGAKHSTTDGENAEAEDTRPWVVKVVRREATIGPHTFHLHEIFGLTSSTSSSYPPTSTAPAENPESHTYPPVSPVIQDGATAEDEGPQSECLLCLSAPREVVLLPCRHLVACKECALNMVEFGAGGTIQQAVEPAVPTGDTAEGGVEGAPSASTPAPVIPTNPRRKRKAKGWFCPVCRQPYTSLLRLTAAPPPTFDNKEDLGSGSEDEELSAAAPATIERNGGILGALRGLSLRPPPVPTDVESQAGIGRSGA